MDDREDVVLKLMRPEVFAAIRMFYLLKHTKRQVISGDFKVGAMQERK